MSPERKEARGIETQDTQRRTLSRVSLHEMWSMPGLVSLSADQERARRRMSNMRAGAMRSMRCYVAPRKLYGEGYLQILRRREAHYVPGMQGTTACATTTATATHEKEQTSGLHMQASASTHTEVPNARQICRRQTISRLRCYDSSRLRLVHGTAEEEEICAR